MDIGKTLIESVTGMLAPKAEADEIVVAGKAVKTEEFGTPVADGDTIKVPVVIASVYEMGSDTKGPKLDQAFVDKNRDAILQRLVVRMNRGNGDPYATYRTPVIYFDSGNFKLEYLEGNVLRLRTTIIIDFRDTLENVRSMKWRMSDAVWELLRVGDRGMKSVG
jgi:hypothetical protein